ncbi:3-hydroxybutyryl-CoA dehydrogenase [Streptomyces zagrosensis]|uniref:3-hydroxybutyryl-CoA dehydrogenase n=1 Tax=Streptomyces zagrosensis TaxID=1042984 RepID=A0A7W9QBK1_9ACTN|nr:3-hydroxybutyryl-CoA dehydrogenase [Streptomyces zagrosensis]MBB5937241.1 3-hydroxybutyryl-CoA dehydrogenase [Streptomyces zagrosensis]
MSEFRRIGVVGCGVMGAGFTEVVARAGLDVTVLVRGEKAIDRGMERLLRSLERAVRKGKISGHDRDAAMQRVSFATRAKALHDRQLVVEAVGESLDDKRRVLAELDDVVQDPDAVLASSTSSIPISKLGQGTRDPGRLVGVHFFNPAPVMPLVELVGSLPTRAATLDRVESFLTTTLGKQVVRAKDQPGFIVNALLVPYLLAAVRMLEAGAASAEEIDQGMTLGCGHPMGPLALIDLIGLDTIASIGEAMYAELKEPLYAPPSLLLRMLESGLLGRKSGQGFHLYA